MTAIIMKGESGEENGKKAGENAGEGVGYSIYFADAWNYFEDTTTMMGVPHIYHARGKIQPQPHRHR